MDINKAIMMMVEFCRSLWHDNEVVLGISQEGSLKDCICSLMSEGMFFMRRMVGSFSSLILKWIIR